MVSIRIPKNNHQFRLFSKFFWKTYLKITIFFFSISLSFFFFFSFTYLFRKHRYKFTNTSIQIQAIILNKNMLQVACRKPKYVLSPGTSKHRHHVRHKLLTTFA